MKKCYIIIKELPLFEIYFTSRIFAIFNGQAPIELRQRELTPVVIENGDLKLTLKIPQLQHKEFNFTIDDSKFKDKGVNIIEVGYDRNWYWKISKFSKLIIPVIVFLSLLNASIGKEYSLSITLIVTILATLVFINFLIKWYKIRHLKLKIVTV